MTIDDKIARVKELITKREEIDAELAALLAGVVPSRKATHCSACGQAGHTAKTCTAIKDSTSRSPPRDQV
jgi:hypothetical protein